MTAEPRLAGLAVRLAGHPDEFAGAFALRHQIFCIEQRIFACDRDEIDDVASTIVACLGTGPGCEIVGTVRIHEAGRKLWFGSRLAVAPAWRRRAGLGAALIGVAVGTAHAHGCRRFLAHVQARNVCMFESLHWRRLEDCLLHGHPHTLMQADLDFYPPIMSAQQDAVGSAA
jgi:putative N-acetyltransferase (TIGR04045 family)